VLLCWDVTEIRLGPLYCAVCTTSAVGRSADKSLVASYVTAARVDGCWIRLVKYPPHVTGTCKLLSEFVRSMLQHSTGPKTSADTVV